ncbi:MFS transporter [Kutzneria viridogrisea]|uniref:MFS family permease n=1 Tax=Kutzneria viridogrisea TaxID=47990 RepID=A0ABR6BRT9_9PSEU|nr:MFS family permease [Kutzneria viridogrisea]
MEGAARAARYRDVFGNGEFRSLWFAELISTAGDQVARVALSYLVYQGTESAALAALTFALTMLPALFGPLLAGLADRYPRRQVMIVADVLRAVLVGFMAIPNLPLYLMFPLVFVVTLVTSPSNAARGALLADVLSGDELTVGQGLRGMVDQVGQVGGYALGGFLIAAFSANGALLGDAASFVLSALLIIFGVRRRPAANAGGEHISLWESTRRGAVLVWSDQQLRTLVALIWMIGLPVAAEGLAVPYVAQTAHQDPVASGWLLAANPLGAVLGAFLITKLAPALRLRLMGPLAAASGLPLLVCVLQPPVAVSCLMFGLSGAAAAYMVVAPPAFIQRTPVTGRGQAIGLMSSGAIAAQGIAVALAGVVAEATGSAGALGITGVATLVVGAALALAWKRASGGAVLSDA